jgi:hypothetical protein
VARKASVLLFVCVVSLLLAGCGGGRSAESHAYVFARPEAGNLAKGVSVTVVSPVAIPGWRSHIVESGTHKAFHAAGPQACSYTKHVQGLHGAWASLNGQTVTVKVNGSSQLVSTVCSTLKESAFDPSSIGGNLP